MECRRSTDALRHLRITHSKLSLNRPVLLRERSAISSDNPHKPTDMYHNDAFFNNSNLQDISFKDPNSVSSPSSGLDLHRRSTSAVNEHIPSFYYKDYEPVGSVPQTPSSPHDSVFAANTPTISTVPRMNGYIRNMNSQPNIGKQPTVSTLNSSSTTSNSLKTMESVPIVSIPVLNFYGIHSNAAVIGLTSVLSLAMGVVAMQLLLNMSKSTQLVKSMNISDAHSGKIVGSVMYTVLYEATVALCSVVIMLNMTCTLVCTMQCFFTARLLKRRRGYKRAFKYLKECSGTRLLCVSGFFLSIPTFLASLMLYCIMELQVTSAIITTVVLGVGIVTCLAAYVESIVHLARHKAEDDDDTDNENSGARDAKRGTAEQSMSSSMANCEGLFLLITDV